MKYRYLPATIMLSAGAITIFICIYNRYETLRSLEILLAVLIIFLIIGSLTKKALIKIRMTKRQMLMQMPKSRLRRKKIKKKRRLITKTKVIKRTKISI